MSSTNSIHRLSCPPLRLIASLRVSRTVPYRPPFAWTSTILAEGKFPPQRGTRGYSGSSDVPLYPFGPDEVPVAGLV